MCRLNVFVPVDHPCWPKICTKRLPLHSCWSRLRCTSSSGTKLSHRLANTHLTIGAQPSILNLHGSSLNLQISLGRYMPITIETMRYSELAKRMYACYHSSPSITSIAASSIHWEWAMALNEWTLLSFLRPSHSVPSMDSFKPCTTVLSIRTLNPFTNRLLFWLVVPFG